MIKTVTGLNVPLDEISAICQRFGVRELAVFGSAMRDDFGPESDIDLLVEFEPEARIGFMELGAMERELGVLFGRAIDLVPKRGLRPQVRDRVLATARVLYAG